MAPPPCDGNHMLLPTTGGSQCGRSHTKCDARASPPLMTDAARPGPEPRRPGQPQQTAESTPVEQPGRRRTGASRAYDGRATGAKISPVGGAASAISRFIHAFATSISIRLRPGRRAPVTSTATGAVHTTPQSIPFTRTRARSPTSPQVEDGGASRRVRRRAPPPSRTCPPRRTRPPPDRGRSRAGVLGSSSSSTPGRASRHGPPSATSAPAARRQRPPDPPSTRKTDPSAGSSSRSPLRRRGSAAPAKGHRVPGDGSPARRVVTVTVDRLAAAGWRGRPRRMPPIRRPMRSSSAPSTISEGRTPIAQRAGRGRGVEHGPPAPHSRSHSRACSPSSSASDGEPMRRRPTTAGPPLDQRGDAPQRAHRHPRRSTRRGSSTR